MYRCFVAESLELGQEIQVDEYNHIVNSLRKGQGDRLEVASSSGVFIGQIIDTRGTVQLRLVEGPLVSNESPIKISLYQALAKGDKVDHVVRKAVELGVHEIYPISTKRCVVKLEGKKKDKRIGRYQAIAESAAKQAKRDYIPKVHNLRRLEDIEDDNLFLAYEEEGASLKEGLKSHDREEISILVGPEGGLDREEVDLLAVRGGQGHQFWSKNFTNRDCWPFSNISYSI